MFKNGCNNVHDEDHSGRLSLVTNELTVKINEKIYENRHITIKELLIKFSQISQSLLHESVAGKLGYHKFCTRWVLKLPTEDHKKKNSA